MIEGLSIRQVIDRCARTTPDQVFLVAPETGASLTYSDLCAGSGAFAARLAAQGLRTGDRVAYALHNGLDAARVILGSMYGGYLATAVNLVAGSRTIAYVLEHSRARVVFVQAATRAMIAEAAEALDTPPRIIEVGDDWFAATSETGPAQVAPDQDALLMYTSGTTGRPKGVVLTHAALLAGGRNTALAHQLSATDRGLCVLPLYHINGLCVTVMGPLVSGGGVVMPPRFSASAFWDQLGEHRCSWFSVVPTQISYLLHDAKQPADRRGAPGRLRFGRSASAPLAPEVQRAFESRFGVPIIETMGLTETAAQILSNPLPPGTRKIGSPGIAFGNDVIIADAKQAEMPRGTEGEILVRGPNVMRCYLDDETATGAALTEDGWFRTGDLGRMDEDGYVFVTGRLKELIIKGGENIAPREIDEVLYEHGDVIEAAAFARPCDRYGQRVEAAVLLRDGATVAEIDLLDLCRHRLGTFKAPDRIFFLGELPKGPSGKIQRLKLAEMTAV